MVPVSVSRPWVILNQRYREDRYLLPVADHCDPTVGASPMWTKKLTKAAGFSSQLDAEAVMREWLGNVPKKFGIVAVEIFFTSDGEVA